MRPKKKDFLILVLIGIFLFNPLVIAYPINLAYLEDDAVRITNNSIWDHTNTMYEDSLGQIWVTWASGSSRTTNDIYIAPLDETGHPTTSPIPLIITSGNDWFPYAVRDKFGTIWMFYSSNCESGNYNIYYITQEAGNEAWSDPLLITTQSSHEYNPCAFIDSSSTIWLFYWSDFGSDRDIFVQKYNVEFPTGWSEVEFVADSEYWEEIYDCHISRSGKMYLFGVNKTSSLWHTSIGTYNDITSQWTFEAITADENYGWGTVFADSNDNIHVLYEKASGHIYYEMKNLTLGSWSEPEVITQVTNIHSPKSLVDSYGNLWITWYSESFGNMEVFVKNHDFIGPISIPATIDVDPDTLNLKSNGLWITAFIELIEGYNVNEIDLMSITLLLEGTPFSIDSGAPYEVGDHDTDGIPDLMVKFDRQLIIDLLQETDFETEPGEQLLVEFRITGVVNGVSFEGSDWIRILKKGK